MQFCFVLSCFFSKWQISMYISISWALNNDVAKQKILKSNQIYFFVLEVGNIVGKESTWTYGIKSSSSNKKV